VLGIGFLVITDVEECLRRRRRLSLHTKHVMTTALIRLAPQLCLLEAENVLAGRPVASGC
jgi:hypothetical protein